jgi:DNA mismatch endonuclease, patch repair protein
VDIVDRVTRSRMMSGIRNRNTRPEVMVRKFLHKEGLRFRIHVSDLPGRPDIVLPKYRAALFVHGCFWHRHKNCKFCYMPKSRRAFWENKFRLNVERDRRNVQQIRKAGWRAFIVWGCEAANQERLERLVEGIVSGKL